MKKVKKFGIAACIIILAAGAVAAGYVLLPARVFDVPEISFAGTKSTPLSGVWHTELLNGFVRKDTPMQGGGFYADLGTIEDESPVLLIPDDAARCTFELIRPYESVSPVVAEGTYEDFQDFTFTANGAYCLNVTLGYDRTEETDAADFTYQYFFTLDVRPQVTFSSSMAVQGDVIRVFADMAFEKDEPTIESELGYCTFVPLGDNCYEAYVPIGYNQTASAKDIFVRAGGEEYKGHVVIVPANFEVERFDMPADVINETMNVPGANQDYREKIGVLSDERYVCWQKLWDGPFIQPVEGVITSSFGLYRYINNSATPSRHQGIDIAAPEGTPVPASNSGQVVLADFVIMTGNTVVIEHGAGLKTIYMHLSELSCSEGDLVQKGDIIGKVGTTGYSTGPHLHFEVRIGDQSVSPWPLIDGSSAIYGE